MVAKYVDARREVAAKLNGPLRLQRERGRVEDEEATSRRHGKQGTAASSLELPCETGLGCPGELKNRRRCARQRSEEREQVTALTTRRRRVEDEDNPLADRGGNAQGRLLCNSYARPGMAAMAS